MWKAAYKEHHFTWGLGICPDFQPTCFKTAKKQSRVWLPDAVKPNRRAGIPLRACV